MAPGILFDVRTQDSISQSSRKSTIRVQEWPGRLTSGLAWDPSMISHESSYTYSLTATNIQEIENALESFKCKLQTPYGGFFV